MKYRKYELVVRRYSEELLTLIDERDEFTRSDLQGMVEALVMNIFDEVQPEPPLDDTHLMQYAWERDNCESA